MIVPVIGTITGTNVAPLLAFGRHRHVFSAAVGPMQAPRSQVCKPAESERRIRGIRIFVSVYLKIRCFRNCCSGYRRTKTTAGPSFAAHLRSVNVSKG